MKHPKKGLFFLFILFIFIAFALCKTTPAYNAKKYKVNYQDFLNPPSQAKINNTEFLKPYLDFLKEVYDTMDKEYYKPISEETYAEFVLDFSKKILSRLKDKKNVVPEIKHLGAGLLVRKLKDPKDSFSNFIPPLIAEDYQQEVLGYELGLGISGQITDNGYLIDKVEYRSNSYAKGIRPNDIIKAINGKDVLKFNEKELQKALFPPLGTTVDLKIYFPKAKETSEVNVKVEEFFKETLSSVPTGIPGMFYVKINQFNRKTGEDLYKLLFAFMRQGMKRLIIDLRGNAGGPPLAAREIAGLFFENQKELFYFKRKNRPKITLTNPKIPINFKGEIAILIDEGSGSASELFAGALKEYNRAILIGAPSAGKTFLKSLFHFDDESMLALVTSLAYLHNGKTYSSEGIEPDYRLKQEISLFTFIADIMDKHYAD